MAAPEDPLVVAKNSLEHGQRTVSRNTQLGLGKGVDVRNPQDMFAEACAAALVSIAGDLRSIATRNATARAADSPEEPR